MTWVAGEKILSMASPLPSLQARKGSAVSEFLGWLIEKMVEVGTRSSMTSNHEIISEASPRQFKYLAFEPLLLFGLLKL